MDDLGIDENIQKLAGDNLDEFLDIKARIRNLRIEQGLSVEEVADRSMMSVDEYVDFENGGQKPSTNDLLMMSLVCNVRLMLIPVVNTDGENARLREENERLKQKYGEEH